MPERRSVWEQPVAPLFAMSHLERRRRARPLLRQMRLLLLEGRQTRLLDTLFACQTEDLLDRELARWALRMALIPGLELDQVSEYGDPNLALWLVDRALERCGAGVHRGGYRVSSGPGRLTAVAA